MTKAVYINIEETTGKVSKLLIEIMLFVSVWGKKEKTPTPKAQIIEKMRKKGKSEEQIDHAINMLIRFGYIRKSSYSAPSSGTSYVQLRTVST